MSKLTKRHKKGFAPFADQHSRVLILGSMPGERSLQQQEYYAHPQNLFWKMMSHVTGQELPHDYQQKIKMLNDAHIAVWDVCDACIREGSLDSAILDEKPNPIPELLQQFPQIKAIAFNGNKAGALYRKYFKTIPGIQYYHLPSTSPANAGIPWHIKLAAWKQIASHLH
jgi:hypoxanthine-DNA glycosylase